MYAIPVTNEPNQTFSCSVPIDGDNRPLSFRLRYNWIAKYWSLTIIDARDNATLIGSVPLMAGEFPAADFLGQFSYMGIGSAVVVPDGDSSPRANPDGTNLGSGYYLVWGDTLG